MGLFDKFKGFVGVDDADYDEEMDGDLFDEQEPEFESAPQAEEPKRTAQSGSASAYSAQNSGFGSMNSAIELRVVKPKDYGSVTQIADHLLARRTVVLNLEDSNKETARRLIDFLSGVAYSINGQLKRVANNTFVITPNNVEVSGEQLKSERREEPKEEPKAEETASDDLYSNL